MFGIFKNRTWLLDDLTSPWGSNISIYAFIHDNPNSQDLPDADLVFGPKQLKWGAGALDGTYGRHMALEAPEKVKGRAEKLIGALSKLLDSASNDHLQILYANAIEGHFLPIADEFLKELSPEKPAICILKKLVRSVGISLSAPHIVMPSNLAFSCWKLQVYNQIFPCWKPWRSMRNLHFSPASRWQISQIFPTDSYGLLHKKCMAGVEYSS